MNSFHEKEHYIDTQIFGKVGKLNYYQILALSSFRGVLNEVIIQIRNSFHQALNHKGYLVFNLW